MPSRFEKFSERARRVLTSAQEEAQNLNHNYIGTEHILLGLIREEEGVAAKVLTNMGISLTKLNSPGIKHHWAVVPPTRLERVAYGLGNRRSILLSYGGNGEGNYVIWNMYSQIRDIFEMGRMNIAKGYR